MRKRIAALLLCSMMILLTACSNEPAVSRTDNNNGTIAEQASEEGPGQTAQTEASAGQKEHLTLKIGFSTDASDPRVKAAKTFKRLVEEQTKNKVTVELYPNGELGADIELIQGVIEGNVDMTVSSAGNFANYVTKAGVSAFPFLFSDFGEAWKFVDGDVERQIEEELEEYNIKVLAHFDNGFRCVTTSEAAGPIYSVSDMSGIKIRTPENQIVMETLSTLGAEPYVLDFTKLYDALQNGEYDAQENPIPVIYNSRLYEVQSFLAVTNHSYDMMPFVIRADIWNSLTAQEQEILQSAALEAQKQNRKMIQTQTSQYIKMLEQKGMTITYPNLEEFKEATTEVYDYFAASYGEELMELLKQ